MHLSLSLYIYIFVIYVYMRTHIHICIYAYFCIYMHSLSWVSTTSTSDMCWGQEKEDVWDSFGRLPNSRARLGSHLDSVILPRDLYKATHKTWTSRIYM